MAQGQSSNIFCLGGLGTVSYTTVLCIVTQHSPSIHRDVAKLRLMAGLSEDFEVDG